VVRTVDEGGEDHCESTARVSESYVEIRALPITRNASDLGWTRPRWPQTASASECVPHPIPLLLFVLVAPSNAKSVLE